MMKIIKFMKENYPGLLKIELMSDGCAAQFKNKFYLSNLLHAEEFGVKLTAYFYGTNHGKSLCDAVGGTLKRHVRARTLTGEFNIYNAKDFVECSSTFVKNIIVWEVNQDQVLEIKTKIDSRWSKLKTLSGTRSFHFFKPSETHTGYLDCAVTSFGHGLVTRKLE